MRFFFGGVQGRAFGSLFRISGMGMNMSRLQGCKLIKPSVVKYWLCGLKSSSFTRYIDVLTWNRSCRPPVALLSPSFCLWPGSVQSGEVCWTHLSRILTMVVLVCCVALVVSVPWVSALSSSEARGKDKQEDPFNYTLSIYAHPGFSSGTGAKQSMMAGWRSRVSYICINPSVYTVRIL